MGTRPEAIKMAPVIFELRRRPNDFVCKVCVSGQHRELLDQVMDIFSLEADYNLRVMTANQSLSSLTSKLVDELHRVYEQEHPDVVLVQGDTTTVFCASLVAFYHKIKVGHVEAGLRTEDKFAPFPEEINRRLTSVLTEFHFAPTERSKQRLLREGYNPASIFVTGNTVIDALLWVRDSVRNRPPLLDDKVKDLFNAKRVILVTGHRRENFGSGFEHICQAIRELADRYDDVAFVYPVHLNPNVQKPVYSILGDHPRIALIAPAAYDRFVWMMDRAYIILTDSGGVQEEAPSLGKPVIVMRDKTERQESIDCGNAKLVGTSKEKIIEECSRLLNDSDHYKSMTSVANPYGDGSSARQIVDVLAKYLK